MTQAIGAVMVAGGGVAGIQAARDLADSGFFVYVIEKTPGIGGAMAQLDKTFPTTDCFMCILAPYLVSAGRHPNIKLIMTCASFSADWWKGSSQIRELGNTVMFNEGDLRSAQLINCHYNIVQLCMNELSL